SARWHDDAHDRLDAGCAIHERLPLERTRNGAKGESTDDGPERSLRERVQDSDGRGGSDEVAEKMAFAEDADPRRRRDVERNERSENEKGLRDATSWQTRSERRRPEKRRENDVDRKPDDERHAGAREKRHPAGETDRRRCDRTARLIRREPTLRRRGDHEHDEDERERMDREEEPAEDAACG